MGVGEDSGEGSLPGPLWPVEHLGFETCKLVLQVREILRQGLDDARVDVADNAVIRGAQVLGTCQIIPD